jgi:hypothetical protein
MKIPTQLVVSFCGALLALVTVSSATASADPYVGKTYAEASATIAERNGTPVIATVNGSQLATGDCLVVSWSKSGFLDSSGNGRSGEYLMNLNCNRVLASPGHPGGSLMSPGGPKAKKDETFATKVAENPGICDQSEAYANRCARVCAETKLCEYEA